MTFKTCFPALHKELLDYTDHNLQILQLFNVQGKKKKRQNNIIQA